MMPVIDGALGACGAFCDALGDMCIGINMPAVRLWACGGSTIVDENFNFASGVAPTDAWLCRRCGRRDDEQGKDCDENDSHAAPLCGKGFMMPRENGVEPRVVLHVLASSH